MILSEKSLLRNPPLILHPKQVVTFNAIRYSLDICDISYNRLIESLSELPEKETINPYEFPKVFLDVWSIINNSVVFKKIICREFNLKQDEPYLTEINKAIHLRNSNQHLDERLSQVLSKEDIPVYGILTWRKNFPSTNHSVIASIYSGTFTNKKKASMEISNQSKSELNDFIQRIELTSVIREGKKGAYTFREEKVLINSIIEELKWWTNHFDKQIEQQMKGRDIIEKHLSDLIITVPLL